MRNRLRTLIALTTASLLAGAQGAARAADDFDVVVYGGTAGGVTAAVQATRMGKRVAIVDPSTHLGGMSSGGLGFTDVGNPATVGGLARDFYHRVWQAYRDPAAWVSQTREQFARVGGQNVKSIDDAAEVQWTFEPHVAEQVFNAMVREAGITRIQGRLDLTLSRAEGHGGVEKAGPHVRAIRLEGGRTVGGQVFVDASYEGDLMALAGVGYTVGREANAQYGETTNGIQAERSKKNQLPAGIDPFRVPGNPASGLLDLVNKDPGGPDGGGDRKVQSYCYRVCLTDVPANRIPVDRPAGYDERAFELVLRAIEAGQPGNDLLKLSPVPNHKTDTNNTAGASLDLIGANYDYADGDYAARDRIVADHQRWSLGLIFTLQHSSRIPAKIRQAISRWGLPRDEFADSGHLSRQLYVREGRRMIGSLVETELLLRDDSSVSDPIAMGSYKMDSHNCQRVVDPAGHVRNEGDVQISVPGPYKVSYRAITPKQEQCDNLLVPWCLSATHIAYGSIRMEPVFMEMGQSAGTAAAMAIDAKVPVQQVDPAALNRRLLADGQVLAYKPGDATAPAGTPARVVCLGDSITHKGYPQVLGELLNVTTVNAGVDGEPSKAGVRRVATDVLPHRPEVAVVFFGTNDLRVDAPKVYETPEQYAADLTAIVEQLRKAGVKPVICTLPPIDATAFYARHDKAKFDAHGGLAAMIETYRVAAAQTAGALGVPLVDLNAALSASAQWKTVDGVHPTPEATRLIASLVARQVAPLLKS